MTPIYMSDQLENTYAYQLSHLLAIFAHPNHPQPMFNLIARLFGTQQERDIKKLKPYIQKINHLHEQLKPRSNDQLRKETDKLRTHIQQQVASIEQNISTLQAQAAQTDDIKEQCNIYNDIDHLKRPCRL